MNTKFRRYLRLDSPMHRGSDVLALQLKLGLPEAQRDGVFGPTTQRAVMEFQRKNQLKSDGVVGPKTWRLLFGAEALQPGAENNSTQPNSLIEKHLPELKNFHRRYSDSINWRLTARGVEIEGKGIETTLGKPETVRRACNDYREDLEKAARTTGVPVELIVATMCTEAYSESLRGVNPRAERKEPGYISDQATPHRVSYGLMQTLLSTARHAMSQLTSANGFPTSETVIDREWLLVPANSILAGAAYIASQANRTRLDPPVVACAYNAGSVIYNGSAHNRWKMKQYPIGTDAHANRFIRWLNDCFRFFQDEGCPFDATITFWQQFEQDSVIRSEPEPTPELKSTSESLARPVFIFPFKKKPDQDYKSGGREFGASRSSGQRKHAGCDLKAPKGTEILAMANGRIIRGPAYFYEGTYALEVEHENNMVIRYGEISGTVPKGIETGAQVSQGQVIAFVGRLNSGNSMLHLEMYSGKKNGPLSQTGNPFKRRADLIDPTEYLDRAPLFDQFDQVMDSQKQIETEDRSQNPEPGEPAYWEQALINAQTTGALSGGLDTSHKTAADDLPRIKELADLFQTAASKFGIPGVVLAALASRESRCGAALRNGWDNQNHAFGILQIDKRYHELAGLPDPKSLEHIEQGAGIFCANLERIAEKYPEWEPSFILKGAAVAYNAGVDTVKDKENMDIGSTGEDYGSDVVARAKYYYENKELRDLFKH